MILFIDNYDSFTYNLVDLLGKMEPDLKVVRNDEIQLEEVGKLKPEGIVISPGPGRPEDAGISMSVIKQYGPDIPVLGICLGHQSIGQIYGGKVIRADAPVHGKTSRVIHTRHYIFEELPDQFEATRYHSLIVERSTLPDCLETIAETEEGVIMGLQHKDFPITGLQFHPESILTPEGPKILTNWLNKVKNN
ncbi:MAG: aminodeoxychorismate/anthranilate synthase component II [Calditrichaceae bacterium]|jgi:anthranilate synthase component II